MICALLLTMAAAPADIELTIDPNTSRIDVELCVQDECDSDQSSISGFLTVELDCPLDPAAVALEDFDVVADQPLEFHLDYGFFGDIFADARDLRLFHAQPGDQPFNPIIDGSFTANNVPFLKDGVVAYLAEGLICGILRNLGVPCEDEVDLGDDPPGILDEVSADIAIEEGVLRISGRLDFDEPLDPENPELGRITGFAIMNASAPLPSGPDLDGDKDADLADMRAFQLCFGGSGNPPGEACPQGVNADLDNDDDVDLDDYRIFFRCFAK